MNCNLCLKKIHSQDLSCHLVSFHRVKDDANLLLKIQLLDEEDKTTFKTVLKNSPRKTRCASPASFDAKSKQYSHLANTAAISKKSDSSRSLLTASLKEKLGELSAEVNNSKPMTYSDDVEEEEKSMSSICDRSVNTKINYWKTKENLPLPSKLGVKVNFAPKYKISPKPKDDCVSKFIQQEAAYDKGVRNRLTRKNIDNQSTDANGRITRLASIPSLKKTDDTICDFDNLYANSCSADESISTQFELFSSEGNGKCNDGDFTLLLEKQSDMSRDTGATDKEKDTASASGKYRCTTCGKYFEYFVYLQSHKNTGACKVSEGLKAK